MFLSLLFIQFSISFFHILNNTHMHECVCLYDFAWQCASKLLFILFFFIFLLIFIYIFGVMPSGELLRSVHASILFVSKWTFSFLVSALLLLLLLFFFLLSVFIFGSSIKFFGLFLCFTLWIEWKRDHKTPLYCLHAKTHSVRQRIECVWWIQIRSKQKKKKKKKKIISFARTNTQEWKT